MQLTSSPPGATSLAAAAWHLRDDTPNEWGWFQRAAHRQDLASWPRAAIGASVQEVLQTAGTVPALYRDLNSRAAEWTEHRDWIYGLDFDFTPSVPDQRIFLEFDSVADVCHVYLNGTLAGAHEGPGAPFDLEVGPLLRAGPNQLLVLLAAVPREDPQIGRTAATRSLKGRLGYGMDFAPRLVTTGILGDVRWRVTGPTRWREFWARPHRRGPHASVLLSARVDGPARTVRFTVRQGATLCAEAVAVPGPSGLARARLALPDAQLWWPAGLGAQPLYQASAEALDGSDRATCTFGIRTIRWRRRAAGRASEWPLALEVNGQRVFQKGWNWVPADMLGGARADAQMRPLLALAQAGGANILRVWGGADPESPAFYAECDHLGLLIWQEFPLCSGGLNNVPPTAPAYLARLRGFAREVVLARRNHPSLALWGGGNELRGDDGLPLRLEHPYAEALAAAIHAVDPDRAFRPSSPLGPAFEDDPAQPELWDVHGPWEYSERWPGAQYWRFNAAAPILHSEVGVPGEASLEQQAAWLSPPHRSRDPEDAARRHHSRWWEHGRTLEQVFGPIEDATLAVLASQWLQGEALRYVVEETRRRWPQSVGVFPWQLNEPWPMVVCTSVVEYGGRPKLAYQAVQDAYRPRLATARYAGLRLAPGAPLRAEIWTLYEGAGGAADLTVRLTDGAGHPLAASRQQRVKLARNRSARQDALEIALPAGFVGLAVLELGLDGVRSRYLFSNRQEWHLREALATPELLSSMFGGAA
jgi:beta-mannosidase